MTSSATLFKNAEHLDSCLQRHEIPHLGSEEIYDKWRIFHMPAVLCRGATFLEIPGASCCGSLRPGISYHSFLSQFLSSQHFCNPSPGAGSFFSVYKRNWLFLCGAPGCFPMFNLASQLIRGSIFFSLWAFPDESQTPAGR